MRVSRLKLFEVSEGTTEATLRAALPRSEDLESLVIEGGEAEVRYSTHDSALLALAELRRLIEAAEESGEGFVIKGCCTLWNGACARIVLHSCM